MFTFIKNAFADKDTRRRIFFTLFIFAVFQLSSHIPVPGVRVSAINTFAESGLLGLLNTFGGGALKRFSLFAMGVSPYITASIIIQLLQMDIVPKFTEWAKQGEVGRRKLNQWTTYVAIALGLVQSYGIALGFNRMARLGLIANPTTMRYLTIALILTAGSMFLVWLGEMITRSGVGNGLSMIIMAGIVAEVPKELMGYLQRHLVNGGDHAMTNMLSLAAIILVIVILIVIIVLMERAQLRIPIHYSKKASGARYSAHLPLKINSAGVIPVIFASSFITTPQMIFSFVTVDRTNPWMDFLVQLFDYQTLYGVIFYTVLLIAFTYFYSLIQVNPEKVAENLQKSSGYIPSVRPGKDTETYLTKVINRLSGVGALYLTLIAVLPIVAGFFWNLTSRISLSGTSLLIVVGVAIETAKQVEGRVIKRRYQGFIQ